MNTLKLIEEHAQEQIFWPNEGCCFYDQDTLDEYFLDNPIEFDAIVSEKFYCGKPLFWEPPTVEDFGTDLLDSTLSVGDFWHAPTITAGWVEERFIEDFYHNCDFDFPTECVGLADLQVAMNRWLNWNKILFHLVGFRLENPSALFVKNDILANGLKQFAEANKTIHYLVEADYTKPVDVVQVWEEMEDFLLF